MIVAFIGMYKMGRAEGIQYAIRLTKELIEDINKEEEVEIDEE